MIKYGKSPLNSVLTSDSRTLITQNRKKKGLFPRFKQLQCSVYLFDGFGYEPPFLHINLYFTHSIHPNRKKGLRWSPSEFSLTVIALDDSISRWIARTTYPQHFFCFSIVFDSDGTVTVRTFHPFSCDWSPFFN